MERLEAIEDNFAIHELLNRYATMVDGRKWDLMDQVFAPGAAGAISGI